MTTGNISAGKELKTSPGVALSVSKKNANSLEKPLEISDIKTEKAVVVRDAVQSLKKRIANGKKNIEKTTLARVEELEAQIDSLWKETKSDLDKGASALRMGMNGRQVLAQLCDLEKSLVAVTDTDERTALREMKRELDQYLPIVLDRELWAWFQGEIAVIKSHLATLKDLVSAAEVEKRRAEEDASLRRQIAIFKHYEDVNMLKGDVMKRVELASSIPKATRELLFHPVWLTRKLEKEFTVVIEKSRDTHSKSDGCFIAGTIKDVNACILKLETADFASGKRTLLLDGKSIATVMSNASEIEKECGVLLFAAPGNVELSLYGSEKNVGKALAKIGNVKEIRGAGNPSVNMTSDRVQCNSAVGKALVNANLNIEEKCGVSLTLAPMSESPRESFVIVRGPPEGVASAVHEISLAVTRIRLERVTHLNKEALEQLFNLSSNNVKKGFSQVKLIMKFNELKQKAFFIPFLEEATVDVAILQTELTDAILSEFHSILAKILFITERVDLGDSRLSRIWSESVCKLVVASAGDADMEISLRRSSEQSCWIEVWGSSERAIECAKRLVEQVHDPLLLSVPEECIKPMLENKCQVLQSIQAEATVSVNLSKLENEVWIYGLESKKRIAANLFKEFFESVRQALLQLTIKTIPIASDEIGRLIGPKGRIMNGIKEKSELEEIRISESEMKVYLTGSNSSVDHAISLIEEELSARKDASVVQIGLGEEEATAASLGEKASATPRSSQKQKNEWVTAPDESHGTAKLAPALDAQEVFPTLGASINSSAKQAKLKWWK